LNDDELNYLSRLADIGFLMQSRATQIVETPRVFVADKSLRTKALQVALRLLGSEKALSRRLHVSTSDLSKWLRGDGEPTQTVFLRTVDVLIEHSSVDQLGDDELNATASNPQWSSREGHRKEK